MENLQAGDILKRISDGSKWKFIHYKPISTGKSTVRADYEGDDYPARDKNFIHVKAWDSEKNDWQDESHEEFSAVEFQKD